MQRKRHSCCFHQREAVVVSETWWRPHTHAAEGASLHGSDPPPLYFILWTPTYLKRVYVTSHKENVWPPAVKSRPLIRLVSESVISVTNEHQARLYEYCVGHCPALEFWIIDLELLCEPQDGCFEFVLSCVSKKWIICWCFLKISSCLLVRNGDSSVGIAMGYGLDDRGFVSGRGWEFFLFTTASRPALGPTQPLIKRVQGALSLGVKQPGREADHSAPSSAEVKNEWSYTFHSTLRLHDLVLSWSTGTTLPYQCMNV
jgi:hypothetical protein